MRVTRLVFPHRDVLLRAQPHARAWYRETAPAIHRTSCPRDGGTSPASCEDGSRWRGVTPRALAALTRRSARTRRRRDVARVPHAERAAPDSRADPDGARCRRPEDSCPRRANRSRTTALRAPAHEDDALLAQPARIVREAHFAKRAPTQCAPSEP